MAQKTADRVSLPTSCYARTAGRLKAVTYGRGETARVRVKPRFTI